MDIEKIFSNIELPAIIADTKGNCLKMNTPFLSLTHYDKKPKEKSLIFDFLPPEDMKKVTKVQSQITFKAFPTRILGQKGEYIPVDCTVISLKENTLFVFQDRRASAMVEKRVEYVEEYAKKVIDTIDAGIILLDKTVKIVRLNPAAKRILGISDKSIGKDFIQEVPALKSLLNKIINVVEGNIGIEKEIYNIKKYYYRIEIFPYKISKRVKGVILYFENITERMNFQQEEKKARILYEAVSISTQGFDINLIIREIGKKVKKRLNMEFVGIDLFDMEERQWEKVYYSGKVKTREILIKGYLSNRELVRMYFPKTIDKDFIPVLDSVSNYIAFAYDRILLYKQQTRYISFLNALIQVYGKLLSLKNENEIFEELAERIYNLMKIDRVTIFIKRGDILVPVTALGQDSKEIMKITLNVGEGFTGWTASSGIPDYTNDAVNDPRGKHIPGTPVNVRESLLSVPLTLNKEVTGVILLSRTAKGYFTDDDLKMMLSFANIIQSALERNRLYTQIERKYKETNILFNVSQMAMKNKKGEIYSYIVNSLKSFGVDIVSVVGFDNKGDLYVYASEGLGITKFPEKTQFKRNSKVMEILLKRMRSKGIFEIHNINNFYGLKKYLYSKDTVSFYIVPVWDEEGNFILGLLLSFKHLHKMEEDEKEFYRSLSNILTSSFLKDIVSRRERIGEKETSDIISFYNNIDISESETEIMDKIAKKTNEIFNAEKTLIFAHRKNYLNVVSGAGELFDHKGFKIKDTEGLSGIAFQSGKIEYHQDTGKDKRIKRIRGIPKDGTIISSPLLISGEKLGVITLNLYEREGYKNSHKTAIKVLTNIIEEIIERKRLWNIKSFMELSGEKEKFKDYFDISSNILNILKNQLKYKIPGIYIKDDGNEVYLSDIRLQDIKDKIYSVIKRGKERWIKDFFFVPLHISENISGVLFANDVIDTASFKEIASLIQIYLEEIKSLNQIKNNALMSNSVLTIGNFILSKGFERKDIKPYLAQLRRSGNFAYIAILLEDDDKLMVKIYDKREGIGPPKNKVLNIKSTSLITTAFKRKKTILVNNTKRSKLYLEGIKGINSEVCVPIIRDNKIYGIIDIGKDIVKGFSPEEVRFLETLGLFFGTILGKNEKKSTRAKQQIMTDAIFEGIPSGVVLINTQGKIERINKFALKMLSHHRKEVIGEGTEYLFGTEGKSLIQSVIKDGKELHRREIFANTKKREKIPIGFSASPIYQENKLSGGLLILKDLTKIKEMEKRLRRVDTLAVLGEMAAGMAHEIRNPLAAVKTGMEFIKKKFSENSGDLEYINMILSEIVRVERIVNDMISYARRPPVRPIRLNISHPLNKALSIMKDSIQKKHIEVNIQAGEGLPYITGDEDQLEEVFTNILSNAIESLPEKRGKIDISLDKKGSKIIIGIKDNGVGIPSDVLPKIFNPFFTTKQKGIGLGLSITQRIIAEHKGTIKVDSKYQEGTKFYIELPVYREEALL